MPSNKISKYPPLSIFSPPKHNGKSPFTCLDAHGNNTLLAMKTPSTSTPCKKVGRPPKLYYLCKYCTDLFFSKSAITVHTRFCSRALSACRTSSNEHVVLPEEPDEKLEVDHVIEERMEMDRTEEKSDDAAALEMLPSLSRQQSLAKINVHEDLELKDQIDVGELLNSKAKVHSPDFVFKRKSPEGVKSDDESKPLAEASMSDTASVAFDPNIKEIEEIKSAPQDNIRCICKPCSSTTFKTELELMRHVRARHSYPKTKMVLSEVQKFYEAEDRSICPICSKPLPNQARSAFVNHLHTHLAEKLYACKVCGTKFRSESYLSKHTKRHIMTKDSLVALLAKSGDPEKLVDEIEEETDEKVDPNSSKKIKVAKGAVVHRVCYGPAEDGPREWVIKWEKTEYEDPTTKSNVATQTLTESLEESTPGIDFDHSTRNYCTKSDDALVTTPVVDLPGLKPTHHKSTGWKSKAAMQTPDQKADGTPESGSTRNDSRKPNDALVTTPVVDPPDLKPRKVIPSKNIIKQHGKSTISVVQRIKKPGKRRKKLDRTDTRTIEIRSKFDLVQRSYTPEGSIRRSYIGGLKERPISPEHDYQHREVKPRQNLFFKKGTVTPVTEPRIGRDAKRQSWKERVDQHEKVERRLDSFFKKENVSPVTEPRIGRDAKQKSLHTFEERVYHLTEVKRIHDSSFKEDDVSPVTEPRIGRDAKRHTSKECVGHPEKAKRRHDFSFKKETVSPVSEPKISRDTKRQTSEERVNQHEKPKQRHDSPIKKDNVSPVTEPRIGRDAKRQTSKERVDHHEKAKQRHDSPFKNDNVSPVTEPRIGRDAKRQTSEKRVDHHEKVKRIHDSSFKEDDVSPVTEPRIGRDAKRHTSKECVGHPEKAKRRHDFSFKKETVSPVTEPKISRDTKRQTSEERVNHHEKPKQIHDSPFKKDNVSPVTEPRIGRDAKRQTSEKRVDHHEKVKRKHNSSFKEDDVSPVTEPGIGRDAKRQTSEKRVDHHEKVKRIHDSSFKEDDVSPVTEPRIGRDAKRQTSKERVDHHEKAKQRHDSPFKKDNVSPVTEPRIGRNAKRQTSEKRVDHHEKVKRKHDSSFKEDDVSPVTEPGIGRDAKRQTSEKRVDHHEKVKRIHDSSFKEDDVSPVTEPRIGRDAKRQTSKERVDHHEKVKQRHDSPFEKNNVSPVTEPRIGRDAKRQTSEERVDHHEKVKPRHNPLCKEDNSSPVTETDMERVVRLLEELLNSAKHVDEHKRDKARKERSFNQLQLDQIEESLQISEEHLDKNEKAKRIHDTFIKNENVSPVTEPRMDGDACRKRQIAKERIDHHEKAKSKHDSLCMKENLSPFTETDMGREVNSEEHVDQPKRDKAKKKRSFDQLQLDQTEESLQISEERLDKNEKAKRIHDSFIKRENVSPVTEPKTNGDACHSRKRQIAKERIDHHEKAKPKHDSLCKKQNLSPLIETDMDREVNLEEHVDQRKRDKKAKKKRSFDQLQLDQTEESLQISEESLDKNEKAKRIHDSFIKRENVSPVTEPKTNGDACHSRKRQIAKERIDHHEKAKPKHDSLCKKQNLSPLIETDMDREVNLEEHVDQRKRDKKAKKKRSFDQLQLVQREESLQTSEESLDKNEKAKRIHDSFIKRENVSPVTEPKTDEDACHSRKRQIVKERIDHHEKAKLKPDSLFKKQNLSPLTETDMDREVNSEEHVDQRKRDKKAKKKRSFDQLQLVQREESLQTSEDRLDKNEKAKRIHDSFIKKENVSPVTVPRMDGDPCRLRKRQIAKECIDHHEKAEPKHDSLCKRENLSPVTETDMDREVNSEQHVDQRKRDKKAKKKRSFDQLQQVQGEESLQNSEERLDKNKKAKRIHDSFIKRENVSPVAVPRMDGDPSRLKKRQIAKECIDHHEKAVPKHDYLSKKEYLSPVTETDMDREVNLEEHVDQRKRDKKAKKKRSFDQLQVDETEESLPTQETPPRKKANKSRNGMVPRVVIKSTITDQSDQAFERSAEGLIQQLKRIKRSRKESSAGGWNSFDDRPKIRKTEIVTASPPSAKRRRDSLANKDDLSPVFTESETERDERIIKQIRDSVKRVDEHKRSPLVKKENISRHGMVPRVMLESTTVIMDPLDRLFERSAAGLIQQLKHVSSERSRRESSAGSSSSDGCPKIRKKKSLKAGRPLKLLDRMDSIPSEQNFRLLRSGGKNSATSLYV